MINVENDLKIILSGNLSGNLSGGAKAELSKKTKIKKSAKDKSSKKTKVKKPSNKNLSRENKEKKDQFSLREPRKILKYDTEDNPEYISARTEKFENTYNTYKPYNESVIRRLEKSKVDKYVIATEDDEQ